MDTISSAIVRFIYVLSTHQDVQSKLRQEIVEARNIYGNLEYDELLALPYLDAICRETLRLWVLSFYCLSFYRQTTAQVSARSVCSEDVR